MFKLPVCAGAPGPGLTENSEVMEKVTHSLKFKNLILPRVSHTTSAAAPAAMALRAAVTVPVPLPAS